MSSLDWLILFITLSCVMLFGIIKSRSNKTLDAYFKSNNSIGWFLTLLSIMGTQASAITFISAPGQGYVDGMRFVQYYFGLPLAMVALCLTLLPMFHKLKVFTAYEYLEHRFDVNTRALASFIFLAQRGLSTGISIYAPSIILSSLLGWDIRLTTIFMGGFLIIYTVSGGSKAVTYTQSLQLLIIFIGLFIAGYLVLDLISPKISFMDSLFVAGKLGKLNILETKLEVQNAEWWKDKYNIWSGVIGGFFLAFSYFGTDQSQVSRYISAKNLKESRISLLMNGIVKIPMQFFILYLGGLIFVFYLNHGAPLFFNKKQIDRGLNSEYSHVLQRLNLKNDTINALKQTSLDNLLLAKTHKNEISIKNAQNELLYQEKQALKLKSEYVEILKKADPNMDSNDTNYIFLDFILSFFPKGLVGFLIAMIFLAAWGSVSAALNALSSSSIIDIYKRLIVKNSSEKHYVKVSKWFTFFWGIFAILTALFAGQVGSLIETVNVLGSLFYGTILGLFLTAFYFKKVGGRAVFWAVIASEIAIVTIYLLDIISFLWLNAIGCIFVILFANIIEGLIKTINRIHFISERVKN